jgi:GAF domain-containing protein
MLLDGVRPEGRRVLESVAAALRATPGPDAWIQAIFRLEAIARLARERNEWGLADLMAAQMLEHDASYGGSHLALALVAEHRGDEALAVRAFSAAASRWSEADDDLPELKLARARKATPGRGSP